METLLRRWWVEKYRQPWTHELFQQATVFDLLTEYYEDIFEDDPHALLVAGKDADGEYTFDEDILGGDKLLAKWEQEIAQGIKPDLEEGMSEVLKEKMRKEREKKQKKTEIPQGLVFNDDFSNMSADKRKMYESIRVAPGSKEEAELLAGKLLGQPKPNQQHGPVRKRYR